MTKSQDPVNERDLAEVIKGRTLRWDVVIWLSQSNHGSVKVGIFPSCCQSERD
jgi:hypothetical protein